jgi:large repetitive protein
MKTHSSARPFVYVRLSIALVAAMVFGMLGTTSAAEVPLTINVVGVGPDGNTVTAPTEYRWTVEQDATKLSIPGQPATSANYSFSFHTSYMPVVAAGRRCGGTLCTVPALQAGDSDVVRIYNQALPNLDSTKRYFVSVAAEGFQMGGAPVVFSGTGATATVYLNQYPVPTAQISIFVFNDNNPINGAPDLPTETGLAGFHVHLIEAGGTYGASGGEVTQDAFGNPLGTTYVSCTTADVAANTPANPNGCAKVGDPKLAADGSPEVASAGSGIILTNADGVALIQNLYPAKYTILVDPPNADWHQTSTIEGTRGVDAWVRNNEPSFFQEFGPPGHHVFIGFTRSGEIAGVVPSGPNAGATCQVGIDSPCNALLNGGTPVSGRIVNTHHSRPPVFTFYGGAPVTECWVGLNEPLAVGGRALYATPCNKDGTFSIPNVPNGTYELAIWDEPLDMIIAAVTITVPDPAPPPTGTLRDYPVSSWFGRYQGRVFQDIDGTGLPYFAADFARPFIAVEPMSGIEYESTQTFSAGDLKPPFGPGIANNIRFRDGSIYQSTGTKDDGTFAFTEVFPFFNFMVAEIDYARYKATSATVVVDDGGGDPATGKINPDQNRAKLWNAAPGLFGSNDPALAYDPWTRLVPQQQADSECPPGKAPPCYFRTESVEGGPGAILLEALQTFLGATNHIEWGKTPYTITENGGIAGIVYYAITRAEDDPRYAAAENWEPGIARVQVNVFLDCDGDGKVDKPKNDGTGKCEAGAAGLSMQGYVYDQPDVDNYPFCWRDPDSCATGSASTKGPEDVKRSRTGSASTFSYGDVFRWGTPPTDTNPNPTPAQQLHWGLGKTDSWDDSIPTDCPDVTPYYVPGTNPPQRLDCFDGLRNYNQVRPSVFDGGYAFGRVAGQAELPMIIGPQGKGTYILEVVAPPGYLHQGNGDKNVTFGDTLKATPAALPHECVGQELKVPAFLTLFPGEPNPNYSDGATWRKCDMKAVPLLPGLNAAPNFFMYTEAPVAGHGVGFILDDTAAEFNYLAPNFGEKHSPPHLPVSVRDWTDREIARVYSDQFGSYNFLVPSSFTINPPYPSGVMPSMMTACMNHPGPITKDPVTGAAYPTPQLDPFYNRNYTTFCYTFQYLAGKTTYLDTPVLPVAAFAAVTANPLDCECDNGTPGIYSVTRGTGTAPNITATDGGPVAGAGGSLVIVSQGQVPVVNPAFDPNLVAGQDDPLNPGTPIAGSDIRLQKTVLRDYGFGPSTSPGKVMLGSTQLVIASWAPNLITATLPTGASTGQLMVTRGDNGKESVVGITVHVRTLTDTPPRYVNPNGSDGTGCGTSPTSACKTIQAAIDAASPGQLIIVAPGTYNEYVIMDKRVRLQGWGTGSVTINAVKSSPSALATWRAQINRRAGGVAAIPATFDLLPGQELGFNAANNEPLLFGAEEGPGILVVGRAGSGGGGGNPMNDCASGLGVNVVPLHIDGLTITGADSGGGILASGYACGIEISNNRVVGNYGTYGGGIRVGHTTLTDTPTSFTDAVNRLPWLHHNQVLQNGAGGAGGGGGITLGTGSNGYLVEKNYVCGNFSMADGGGLSHLGQSAGRINGNASNLPNRILNNKFIFNQTFNQSFDPMGGGVSIAGHVPFIGVDPEGSGDVLVNANLLQGNQAGAGAGGGVSITRTVLGSNANSTDDVVLTNNMIVNNVAAYAGGGVALAEAAGSVSLVNNTVASNVSTATNRQAANQGGWAFPSNPQVAGIWVLGGSNPTLLNNIVWGNRSYIYLIDKTTSPYAYGLFNPGTTSISSPNLTPSYSDLGREFDGVSPNLAPTYSVLTTGGVNPNVTPSNTVSVAADSSSLFVKKNEFLSITDPTQPIKLQDATVNLQSALVADETGNFINIIFSPLTQWEISGTNIGMPRADYHITGTSAALNSGATGAGVPSTDYDGQNRAAPIDIGADENNAPPPSMHVGDLDWTAAIVDSIRWRATVTVTVHSATHGPLANATVTGSWSAGDTNGRTLTCTTNAAGTCTVTSGRVASATNKTVQFSVTGVTASGLSYQASANHDPDAAPQASNGTTITASPTFFTHVGDLDRSATNTSSTQWSATVTIAVHNVNHAPVANATVAVSWVGQGTGGGSCITSALGTCQVTRSGISRTGLLGAAVIATVTGVTVAGTDYVVLDNHDPDSGAQASNGTSITVPRP